MAAGTRHVETPRTNQITIIAFQRHLYDLCYGPAGRLDFRLPPNPTSALASAGHYHFVGIKEAAVRIQERT